MERQPVNISPVLAGSVAVIMAAGKSTRMKSAVPKALHKICGKEMTRIVIDACREAGIERIIVVVGHEAELVKQGLGDDVEYVAQTEQLGTGHAVMQAAPLLKDVVGSVVVLPGDAPLITAKSLTALIDSHSNTNTAATLLTSVMEQPRAYGRIVRRANGQVDKIVEDKDCTAEQKAIKEVAVSMYTFQSQSLLDSLKRLKPENAQKEYYLTDVIGLMSSSGLRVDGMVVEDNSEVMGINTRVELAEAADVMRRRLLKDLMLSGVTVVDPGTTYVDFGVTVGRDTVIQPCTILEQDTHIGENCSVGPFVRLAGATVGDNTIVDSRGGSG